LVTQGFLRIRQSTAMQLVFPVNGSFLRIKILAETSSPETPPFAIPFMDRGIAFYFQLLIF